MSNQRYDVCSPRPKKDGGVFWHRCGTAFDGEKGVTLIFDSLPLPDNEGRCVVKLFESRPREDRGTGQQRQQPQGNGNSGGSWGGNDDVPGWD